MKAAKAHLPEFATSVAGSPELVEGRPSRPEQNSGQTPGPQQRATGRPRAASGRFIKAAAGNNGAPTPVAATTGWLGGAGYQGADWSRLRGYVYFPTLDTRKELTAYTRTEILRKVRFLKRNVGLVSRLTKGMARMVAGTGLEGQATTTDKEWNRLANQRFHDRATARSVFDLGGRFNFYDSQQMLLDAAFTDGDAGAVLTSSAADLAQFAFYEAHQIGNGRLAPGEEKLWLDGVRLDRFNRPLAYRLLGDQPLSGYESLPAQADIPAGDFIYLGQYESPGFARCASILKHAINKLQDSGEILSAITTGIKQFNQIGYAIETDAGSAAPTSAGAADGLGPKVVVDQGDGTSVTQERIYGPGAVPRLPAGQKLRALLDQRPHPNNLEVLDYLIRDIAWGAGLSPEVVWNIATLGGANTRFILADAQGWIEAQQQRLIDTYCARVWIYTLAKEMKAGRLRRCTDPEWWKHAWITPARLTVDFGRDGKLHIEQLKMGMLTLKRFYGWQGVDSEEQLNQWLDEVADFKAGFNKLNADARKPDDRNLNWDDIQQFRNAVGFRPELGASIGPVEDAAATDNLGTGAAAETALAALARDPARAEALLKKLAHAA